MLEENIKIDSVVFTPTKTGKDRWIVNIPGAQLSCWDGSVAEDCFKSVGKVVHAHIEEKGKYLNLKMIEGQGSPVGAGSTFPGKAPDYASGARVGMAVNNAVLLAIHGKLEMKKEDVDIMQPIARAAAAIIAMSKELEKK